MVVTIWRYMHGFNRDPVDQGTVNVPPNFDIQLVKHGWEVTGMGEEGSFILARDGRDYVYEVHPDG